MYRFFYNEIELKDSREIAKQFHDIALYMHTYLLNNTDKDKTLELLSKARNYAIGTNIPSHDSFRKMMEK